MAHDVISAKHIEGYKVEITFDDGHTGIVDFTGYLARGGVFERFRDLDFFKRFEVNEELGVVTWNGEIDIAPETLYAEATGFPLPEWMSAEDS